MSNPKIVKVEYCGEMSRESSIIFYRYIEKKILDSLPNDPTLKGLFLRNSLSEFKDDFEKE